MNISPRWRWRLMKLQAQIKDWKHDLSQLWKGIAVKHKMCRECRGLIEPGASVCPLCGASAQGLYGGGLSRLVHSILPEAGTYSLTILLFNFILYMIMSAAATGQEGPIGALIHGAGFRTLLEFGADYTGLILIGEIWRWVTSIFLHIGILHLLFNSIALYSLGPAVEEIYGGEKFLFLYMTSGVAGNLASLAYNLFFRHTFILSAGASGAIFGLIGVMAVYGHRRSGSYGRMIRRSMIQWALYGLIYGLLPGVNNVAHVGGLIAGAMLAFLITDIAAYSEAQSALWKSVSWVCMAAIILSFVLAFNNFGTALKKLESHYGEGWWSAK